MRAEYFRVRDVPTNMLVICQSCYTVVESRDIEMTKSRIRRKCIC